MVSRWLHCALPVLQVLAILRVSVKDPIWTKKGLGEWTSRHYVSMLNDSKAAKGLCSLVGTLLHAQKGSEVFRSVLADVDTNHLNCLGFDTKWFQVLLYLGMQYLGIAKGVPLKDSTQST